MDTALIERLREEMRYEFARTAPPEGFPAFHDIPAERYTSQEFYELEREHLWPRAWVLAGRSEEVAEPGDYRTFDDLGVPVLLVRGKDGRSRLLQHVPAPWRAGRAREPADRPARCAASTTRGPTTSPTAR